MRRYEIGYTSFNAVGSSKGLVALVIEPDAIEPGTGVMLFTHGWGNSRFQDVDKMQLAANAFDLVCLSVEYRQSGYDANPVHGHGWDCPYDLSFFQLFDVLNGLRELLSLRPNLNARRLFHYGGSQGGHIALLSAIVAPKTFAGVYSSCGATFVDDHFLAWAGREFLAHERSVRDVVEHAEQIQCPVFLDHGTADAEVSHERHTRRLETRLEQLGKPVTAVYYEGGDHQLKPVSTRFDAFKALAPKMIHGLVLDGATDFEEGRTITVPCGDRTLVVDWGQPATSERLFRWGGLA